MWKKPLLKMASRIIDGTDRLYCLSVPQKSQEEYKMKRIKIILSFLLIFSIVNIAAVNAFATTYYYSSGYEFYKDDTGEAWIINSCSLENDEISLPGILLNSEVSTVGSKCFENRSTLRYVFLPDTIKDLGAYSFSGCSMLSELVLSENLRNIYVGAFRYCNALENLDFSQSKLELIGNAAFYKCISLKKVILPDTVNTIGSNAFVGCTDLKEVYLGRNVSDISSNAFDHSDDLVLYCYRNTYAQQYARDNGIKYVVLDPAKGDANCDGNFNISDATAVQKYKAGLINLPEPGLGSADVNGDNQVTVRDATLIQMRIANIINEF